MGDTRDRIVHKWDEYAYTITFETKEERDWQAHVDAITWPEPEKIDHNVLSQFETQEEKDVSAYWQAHVDANCDKFNCKYCLEEINAFHEGTKTDKGG